MKFENRPKTKSLSGFVKKQMSKNEWGATAYVFSVKDRQSAHNTHKDQTTMFKKSYVLSLATQLSNIF